MSDQTITKVDYHYEYQHVPYFVADVQERPDGSRKCPACGEWTRKPFKPTDLGLRCEWCVPKRTRK